MERCTGHQIKAFSFLSCTASDAKGTKEIKKKKRFLGKVIIHNDHDMVNMGG